jgi:beta-glucosidase
MAVTADLSDSDEFLQRAISSRGRGPDYSRRIDALLQQMTVEEKVGQMTQLTLEMIVVGHDQSIQIDPAKLQKADKQSPTRCLETSIRAANFLLPIRAPSMG